VLDLKWFRILSHSET